jgi:hypothetical protein
MSEERCWCGHLKRWHNLANLCLWCVKMGQRHPQFNFAPHHAFALEIPDEMRRAVGEALHGLFSFPSEGGHNREAPCD